MTSETPKPGPQGPPGQELIETPPAEETTEITLPAHVAGSGALDRLVGSARDYARAATADNTRKAYAADWAHFTRWCRHKGAEPLPPSPEMIGLG